MIDEKKLLDILNILACEEESMGLKVSPRNFALMVGALCKICGWIDAKKTLPEDGQEVLVTEDYDGKRAVKKATYYKLSPYWHKHVVAWMAMPEAYDG